LLTVIRKTLQQGGDIPISPDNEREPRRSAVL
jgi:hypothetical protein